MMKYYHYIIAFLFLFCWNNMQTNAQNKNYYGFSKTYLYPDDSIKRFGSFFYNHLLISNSEHIIMSMPWMDNRWNRITEWLKIDLFGNVLEKKIDSIQNASLTVGDPIIAQNDSGSCFAPGWYYDTLTKLYTARLQKRDTSLNFLWAKDFSFGKDTAILKNTLLQLDDGSLIQFISLGIRDSITLNLKKLFIFLIKTDELGNLLWKKAVDENEWNNAGSVIFAHDGNILISSLTSGYGISTVGAGFVMKIDTAGNKIWHKVFNYADYNGLEKIIATADGHYICAGWVRNPEIINGMNINGAGRIIKIDENGNLIWDKIIDISPREDEFRTLLFTKDGDIVAFGATSQYQAYDIYNYQVGSTRAPDAWAVRLDKDGLLFFGKHKGKKPSYMQYFEDIISWEYSNFRTYDHY